MSALKMNSLKVLSRKTSSVWHYCTPVSRTMAKCDLCKKLLSYSSSTSNLKKHFVRIHPELRTSDGRLKVPDVSAVEVADEDIVVEYLDSNETDEIESDRVSNSSVEDPLQGNQTEKSAHVGDTEKWFVRFGNENSSKTQPKKIGTKTNGKKKSEVRRQLEMMIRDKEKATNLQIEVYNLQMEKERQQMEQNKIEHELRCNILEIKYQYNKGKMELLGKQNVDSQNC